MLVRTLNRHDKLNLLHFKENVSISPLRMTFAVFFFPPIDIHYPGKEAPFYSWSTEVFIFKIIVLIGPFQHLWAQESKTIVCCFYWWEFQCVFLKFQSSHSLKKKKPKFPCTVFGHTFCCHTNGLYTQQIRASELGKMKMGLEKEQEGFYWFWNCLKF